MGSGESASSTGCIPGHGEAEPDAKVLVIESPFDDLAASTMDLLFDGDFPGWAVEHAEILETSLLQRLRPDLVRNEGIQDGGVERRVSYDVLPLQALALPGERRVDFQSAPVREVRSGLGRDRPASGQLGSARTPRPLGPDRPRPSQATSLATAQAEWIGPPPVSCTNRTVPIANRAHW